MNSRKNGLSFSQKDVLHTSVTIEHTPNRSQYNFPNIQAVQGKKILAIFEYASNPRGEVKPALNSVQDKYFLTLVNYQSKQVWQDLENNFLREIKEVEAGEFAVFPNLESFIAIDQEISFDQSFIRYPSATNLVAGNAVTFGIFYCE